MLSTSSSSICLDISDDSYFYILHIVDEIIVNFDTAVASLTTGGYLIAAAVAAVAVTVNGLMAVVVVVVVAAAVIVTMRWDTDVTN